MIYGTSKILVGDCRDTMATLPDQHFHCCVTSPPYFGLRDYGHDGQIGLEPTPDDFVDAMLAVFGGKDNPVGVWRVLRDDGVLWLNLGDSYAGGGRGGNPPYSPHKMQMKHTGSISVQNRNLEVPNGLKAKDLIGIPWRVAFALQSAGWYLRDAVIWHKPAPMPGSQRDRCTSSYEFIFQLTKSARYYFDLEAVKEATAPVSPRQFGRKDADALGVSRLTGNMKDGVTWQSGGGRTPRNVWKIAHEGFNEAHFATFPREIPTRCIKASTSEKGCCPTCGAPWERITDRDRQPTRPGANTKLVGKDLYPIDHPNQRHSGDVCGNRDPQRHTTITHTIGWQPTCDHRQTPSHCRVIDPFNGAGTTGLAANLLGRDYVGCELNPQYASMAENRIARELRPATAMSNKNIEMPLFAEASS